MFLWLFRILADETDKKEAIKTDSKDGNLSQLFEHETSNYPWLDMPKSFIVKDDYFMSAAMAH